jgi:hypothetical protein
MSSGFEEEPNIHRQAACEINTFVDHNDIASRKRPVTDSGQTPYFPTTNRDELFSVRYGEIVARLKGSYPGENKLFATTGLAGAGAEEMAQYPDNPDMIRAAIMARYDIMGVACTEYNSQHDAPDQGFVTAVSGLHTIHKLVNTPFEPGQIARVTLPDEDPSFSVHAKLSPSGLPLAKYPWRVVPEDYMVPGDLVMTHMNAILEDDQKWRTCMFSAGSLDVDKWSAVCRAMGDSAITTSLLTIYVLMKMGYLTPSEPTENDPYGGNAPARTLNFVADTPSEFVLKLAELLHVQTPTGHPYPSEDELTYFASLRRRILLSVFYTGKNRPLEFGQREGMDHTPTRDPKTGGVDLGKPGGLFLHNQINHKKREMGAILQALDNHAKWRIGRVMSGPNRKKNVNVFLERSFF